MDAFSPDRSTYGPYNVLQLVGSDGTKIQTFPYASVKGSQLLIAVSDNTSKVSNQAATVDFLQLFAVAEISIWGKVSAFTACLHRQAVRQLTGPMNYIIPWDLPWNEIEIRARNMSGGRRGTPPASEGGGVMQPPPNAPAGQPPSPLYQYSGFQINATIYLQKTLGNGASSSRTMKGTG